MSKKEKKVSLDKAKKNTEKVKEVVPAPLKYAISPNLNIALIREERAFRFEMPIGAQLTECLEACNEASKIISAMIEKSKIKEAEAKEKEKEKDSQKDKPIVN